VGQLTTQFASWSGCQPVIMLDLFDERLALAGQSGADFTINPHAVDPVAAVMEYTGGLGADLIFEGTRSSQTLPMMMKMAAQSARLMVVGSLTGTVEIDPFTELQLKELEIIGCYQPAAPTEGHAYFPWTQQRNRQITLKMLQGGKLKIDHLITHRMPFQAAAETYELIRSQGQKCLGVVFEW
jgi:L-iditol 2-dehydrogenase